MAYRAIDKNGLHLKYRGRSLVFQATSLTDLSPDSRSSKIALAYQGLSVVVAEVNADDGSYKLYPENVPVALRMIEGLINPHEADLWHIRLKEYTKAREVGNLVQGFVVKRLDPTNDLIIEKDGVVAAWVNLLTHRVDTCTTEQAESGVFRWSGEELKYIQQHISSMLTNNEWKEG